MLGTVYRKIPLVCKVHIKNAWILYMWVIPVNAQDIYKATWNDFFFFFSVSRFGRRGLMKAPFLVTEELKAV